LNPALEKHPKSTRTVTSCHGQLTSFTKPYLRKWQQKLH